MTACSSSGYSAPLCLIARGLHENELMMTDEELKESKGVFALKVKGFSMRSSADAISK